MIRIVEGRRAAIERGVIEGPLRRRELPDELGKIVRVFLVAGPAALGGEIVLVPPFELGLRRQRHLAGFLAADQIAAHGHHGLAALRPERRHDVGGPRAPIVAGDDRLLDLEGIHQGDDIDGDAPTAGRCGASHLKESASCHSRADTGRSPGSPPTPAAARHRHSCGCRRASRAEE